MKRSPLISRYVLTSLLVIQAALLLACPAPEWSHILFGESEPYTKTVRIAPGGVPIEFKISGEFGKYLHFDTLRLKVEVNYKAKSEDFLYHYDNLRIVGEHNAGNIGPGVIGYHPKAGIKKETLCNDSLGKNKYLVFVPVKSSGAAEQEAGSTAIPFRIALDSFVFYRGEPVTIDTIRCCVRCPVTVPVN